jgi:hypothetical protein
MYVNAKMIPVKSTPVIRGGEDGGEWLEEVSEFMYDIFDAL